MIRTRNLIVRPRAAAVNAMRGLAKPCGYRLPASSTLCFGAWRIVSTERVALGGIESALKQGAKDSGFNVAPVGVGGFDEEI